MGVPRFMDSITGLQSASSPTQMLSRAPLSPGMQGAGATFLRFASRTGGSFLLPRKLEDTSEAMTIDACAIGERNYSIGSQPCRKAGFERRVAWLEEDVAVLRRRLRDECDDGGGNMGGACDDLSLSALVQRLDDQVAGERRARESLQTRMNQLEDAIMLERKEREVQLRGFSAELEATMRGLIGRIDGGISACAASMRERSDETETRLRSLIRRVDEGLSAGAAALQDTIGQWVWHEGRWVKRPGQLRLTLVTNSGPKAKLEC